MNDELSPEDELRLNVLFNTELKAIRIDESSMTLWALTPQGEASVPLKPNERTDRYLKRVREQLSGHALGSPGGYPVHLTRWTRQSQAGLSAQHLAQLLLIAEEEAVVAVVHSPALTDELARYAWWCMPTLENARLMLMRDVVCRGSMGRTLAEFLVDHLAFLHEDDVGILDTVAVMLYACHRCRAAGDQRGNSRTVFRGLLELQPDSAQPTSRASGSRQRTGSRRQPLQLRCLKKRCPGRANLLATAALVLIGRKFRKWSTTLLDALAQWCAPLRQADEAMRNSA
jgi:hypothetical protein